MPPRPRALHRARLGALARLQLRHARLRGAQLRAELRHRALELRHGGLELAELSARGTRGLCVWALQQVAVVPGHEARVLEVPLHTSHCGLHVSGPRAHLEEEALLAPLAQPRRQPGPGEGGVQGGHHAAVDPPAVQQHLTRDHETRGTLY